MDKLDKLFDNPGKSVRTIAKFCFMICIVVAIILFIIGAYKILHVMDYAGVSFGKILSYTSIELQYGDYEAEAYTGKLLCTMAFYLALASLSTIPLYAFGQITEDVHTMAGEFMNKKNQAVVDAYRKQHTAAQNSGDHPL